QVYLIQSPRLPKANDILSRYQEMTARSYLQSGINSEKLPGIAKVRVILHPGEIKVCCPRTGNFMPCGHVEVRVGNSCSEEMKENFAKLRRQFVPGEAGRAHPA